MVLTDKQRQFVDAKARGASNKEAAEAAGSKPSTAAAAGSRWANDPKIASAILARRAELSVNPEPKRRRSKAKPDEANEDPVEINEADGEFLSCLPSTDDPLVWLLALMNEPRAKVFDRRNAAQTAVPYIHGKKAEAGKKEQKAEAAKEAGKGKYSQSKPPLTVVKGGRMLWTTACPDWWRRLAASESIIPEPLFPQEAEESLEVFKGLRIVDAPGSPTIESACAPWVLAFAGAVFGSYNSETGERLIREFMLCIPKKNS